MAIKSVGQIHQLLGGEDLDKKMQKQRKVAGMYGGNPFVDKNGSLFNKYINYQKVLDNPDVNSRAKELISAATGLSPNMPYTAVNPTVSSGTIQSSGYTGIQQEKNNIVSSAKNYIGTPYVWGGESRQEGGMDCSGFVYNALKDAGYKIGRTTAQGYRGYGTTVNKTDMQPGDLVFFGKGNNASHIGIYIGNGQMIHSSGGKSNTKANPGKGVSIANVDYRSDFIEARRY